MIKSSFSRNVTKLPASSKKPSLASLAQKLQGVDLNSTSSTECRLAGDGISNPSLPNSITNDGNSILPDSGKYTRTSAAVDDSGGYFGDVSRLIPGNVYPVFSSASQPVSERDSVDSPVVACINEQDGNESIGECSDMRNKRGAGSSDSWNDCTSEFGRLHINPASQKRCRFAKPTPFGQTLSAVPNPLNRAGRRRQQKPAVYARFSYFRQTRVVAGMSRRRDSSDAQTITPFDFATPSPDDVVRRKQKLAFGKHISTKRA